MIIETSRDFHIPRARVLANFRDPTRMETVVRDIGAQVTRIAEPPEPEWACSKVWKDAPRAFTLRMSEPVRDETISYLLSAQLADVSVALEFYDLPDGHCRVIGKTTITPKSMAAKMALQSLRLVRGRAEDRVGRFIRAIGRR